MNTNRHYILFLVLFVFVGIWGLTSFEESGTVPIPVTPGDQIGWRLETQYLSIEEVLNRSDEAGFFTTLKDESNKKTEQPGSEHWIRLPLTNPTDASIQYILEIEYPWIDTAYLYTVEKDQIVSLKTGEFATVADEAISDYNNAFRITLRPNESQTYFLLFADPYGIHPNLKMWEGRRAFIKKSEAQDRFIFAYMGLMLGLLVTNCCVFLVFRYRDLIYYLAYLFSVGLLQGVNFQLHYPLLRWLTPKGTYVFEMKVDYFAFGGFLVISAGFLILFANEFLQLSKLAPRVHKWIKTFGYTALISAPLIMFGPGHLLGHYIDEFVAILWAGSHVVAVCIGIFAASRKLPQARYFLPAILLLTIVSIRFNWTISSGNATSSELMNQWLFASCLEMIAFTYALVERFLEVNRAKEDAQQRALIEVQNFADLNKQYNSKLNKEVQSRTSELKQANEQKDELLRIIAHDLKSPIDSVIKLSDQLADSASEPHYQKLAQQIGSNASNLSELMKNLLEWAKMRALQEDIVSQPYLILDLFEATLTSATPQAKLKQIQIITEVDEELYGDFDFDSIAVVLRNLAMNAIKFSPEHSQIILRATADAQAVTIEVQDSGTGMSAQRLNEINEGQILKSQLGSKGETGTGIGLQICNTILMGHKSELCIQSTLNEGTLCAFKLKKWELQA